MCHLADWIKGVGWRRRCAGNRQSPPCVRLPSISKTRSMAETVPLYCAAKIASTSRLGGEHVVNPNDLASETRGEAGENGNKQARSTPGVAEACRFTNGGVGVVLDILVHVGVDRLGENSDLGGIKPSNVNIKGRIPTDRRYSYARCTLTRGWR